MTPDIRLRDDLAESGRGATQAGWSAMARAIQMLRIGGHACAPDQSWNVQAAAQIGQGCVQNPGGSNVPMDLRLPALMTELGQLGIAVQKFAAIGAALRLRASGQTVPSEVDAAMRDVLSIVLPGSLDGLTQDEVGVALNYVAFQLEEAREMLRDPARPPVWQIEDPAVLQTMGDLSRALPCRILAFGAERPGLAAAATGRFLDVGTGVGAIALEAAARCPSLRVVGLDVWEPALALARANVAASPSLCFGISLSTRRVPFTV